MGCKNNNNLPKNHQTWTFMVRCHMELTSRSPMSRTKSKKILLGFTILWLIVILTTLILTILQAPTQSSGLGRVHLRQLAVDKVFKDLGDRNSASFLRPGQDTVLFEPNLDTFAFGLCQQPRDLVDMSLVLIFIISDPANRPQRDYYRSGLKNTLIRDDILSQIHSFMSHHIVRVLFFMGVSEVTPPSLLEELTEEAEENDDVIIEDFVESYVNLTLKSLFVLKWVSTKCRNVKYMVKMDDDVFFNPVAGFKELERIEEELGGSEGVLAGRLNVGAPPFRDPDSKWFIPEDLWPAEIFPIYANGPFYILSGEIASDIYNASFSVPLFPLEDVYITGILGSQTLGLDLQQFRHSLDKWLHIHSPIFTTTCSFTNHTFIHTGIRSPQLFHCWSQVINNSQSCSHSQPIFDFCSPFI